MLRELVGLLPDAMARCSPGKAGVWVGVGVVLWLCGARFSRSILTLTAVAAGTIIGMRLPSWYGWQIDGMGLGVGGAVVLGTCAFLFHRSCIGLLLGGGMMLWAGMGVWMFMAGDGHWDWRAVHWEGDMIQFARQAWQGLPHVVSRVFPAACFAALAGGITLVVFFPKLSKVLAHSLTGITLITTMGAVALAAMHPDRLASVPGSARSQGLALIGLIVLGAIGQWLITPPFRSSGSNVARNP